MKNLKKEEKLYKEVEEEIQKFNDKYVDRSQPIEPERYKLIYENLGRSLEIYKSHFKMLHNKQEKKIL
jgi:hypothetical protein